MNSNNFKYALVVTALVVVIAIVAGLIFAGKEVATVLYLIMAVLVPTVSGITGVKISADTREKVEDLAHRVDEQEQP